MGKRIRIQDVIEKISNRGLRVNSEDVGELEISSEDVIKKFNPFYRGGEIFYVSMVYKPDLADYIAGICDTNKFKKTLNWSTSSPHLIIFASYFLEIPINKKPPILMAEAISTSDDQAAFIEAISWLGYDLNRIWGSLSYTGYRLSDFKYLEVMKNLINAGSYPKCKYRRAILSKCGVQNLKYNISKKEFKNMLGVIYIHNS